MSEELKLCAGAEDATRWTVERRFSFSPHDEVLACFSQPEAVGPRLWRCRYRITWADSDLALQAYGADGMHALLVAMERVHRRLLVEAAYRADHLPSGTEANTLTWMGQPDLGLPRLGTFDTAAFHTDLIADAGSRGDDLDRVILEECSSEYLKVARIAASALNAIGARCFSTKVFGEIGSDAPDPLLNIILSRLEALVATKQLELRGDLSEPRYSEVRRLPA